MHKQSKEIEIHADVSVCYRTICDFESYPSWQKSIQSVTVLERENDRPIVVEYELDAILKKICYTLHYSYEEDEQRSILTWDYVGGDLKNIEGKYIFEQIAPSKTKATFYLEVAIGKWVPEFVLKKFKEINMKESVEALKKRVESKS